MRFFSTLSTRVLALIVVVLAVSFTVVLNMTGQSLRQTSDRDFEQQARLFTEFLAQQINTGTRLKRAAMIDPQLTGALSTEGLNLIGLRVIHVEGEEVARRAREDALLRDLDRLAAPDFDAATSFSFDGDYGLSRTPIILGAGADAVVVGELATIWDRGPANAALADLQNALARYMAIAGLVAALATFLALYVVVKRPLHRTVAALKDALSGAEKVDFPKSSTAEIREISNAAKDFYGNMQAQNRLLLDLSEVINAAKGGDFSKRLAVEEESGASARGMLNELMDTIDHGLAKTLEALQRLADRDLSTRMEGEFQGAFGDLQSAMNTTLGNLRATLSSISTASGDVRSTSGALSEATNTLAIRTQSTASELAEAITAITQIEDSITATRDLTDQARTYTVSAADEARQGASVVNETIEAITEIHRYSGEIEQIVSLIDDVAFQTSLLALNAGVEAARAGEEGRGFGVVAQEVRALAMRASESASKIRLLITESADKVAEGVDRAGNAGEAITGIVGSVGQAVELISSINTQINEQTARLGQVSKAIGRIDTATQQNAAMVEETTAAAEDLAKRASETSDRVSSFSMSSSNPQTASPGATRGEEAGELASPAPPSRRVA